MVLIEAWSLGSSMTGPCPWCSHLGGHWFVQGAGPAPPLHRNCRCARVVVADTATMSTGERVRAGLRLDAGRRAWAELQRRDVEAGLRGALSVPAAPSVLDDFTIRDVVDRAFGRGRRGG